MSDFNLRISLRLSKKKDQSKEDEEPSLAVDTTGDTVSKSALRMRRYRARLKEKGTFDEYRANDKLQKRKRNATLSEEQKEHQREKARIRVQRCRQKKKENGILLNAPKPKPMTRAAQEQKRETDKIRQQKRMETRTQSALLTGQTSAQSAMADDNRPGGEGTEETTVPSVKVEPEEDSSCWGGEVTRETKSNRPGGEGTEETTVPSVKFEPEEDSSCWGGEMAAEPEDSCEVPEPPSIDMTLSTDMYISWRTIGVMEGLTSDSHIAQFLVALYYGQQKKGLVKGGCAVCHSPLTLYCTTCQCPSPLSLSPAYHHPPSIAPPPPLTYHPPPCMSSPSSHQPPTRYRPPPSLSSPPPLTHHPPPSSATSPPLLPTHPAMTLSTHLPGPVMMFRHSPHVLPPPLPQADFTPVLSQEHAAASELKTEQDTTLVEIKLEPQEEESDTVHYLEVETLHDSVVTNIKSEEDDNIEEEKYDSTEEDKKTAEEEGDGHTEDEDDRTESTQGCKESVNDFPVNVGSVNQDSDIDRETLNFGKRKSSSYANTTRASQSKRRKVTSDGIAKADSCSEEAQKTVENNVVLAQNVTTAGPQKTAQNVVVLTQNMTTAGPQKNIVGAHIPVAGTRMTAEKNIVLTQNMTKAGPQKNIVLARYIPVAGPQKTAQNKVVPTSVMTAAGQQVVHFPHKEKITAACENPEHSAEEHRQSTACESENPDDGIIIPIEERRSALIHTFNLSYKQLDLESITDYVTVKVSENTYKMMTKEAFVAQFGGEDEAFLQESESGAESLMSKMLRYPVRILISGKQISALKSEGGCPLPHYLYTHYECSHCKKAFTKKKLFNNHVQTHIDKIFDDLNSVRHHGRMQELQCKFCGRYCYDKNDYDDHVKLHTENDGVMKCPACPYQTTEYFKFMSHKSYCSYLKGSLKREDS